MSQTTTNFILLTTFLLFVLASSTLLTRTVDTDSRKRRSGSSSSQQTDGLQCMVTAGRDGRDGRDGISGKDGRDGQNGSKGDKGEPCACDDCYEKEAKLETMKQEMSTARRQIDHLQLKVAKLEKQVSIWRSNPFPVDSEPQLRQCGFVQYARRIASLSAGQTFRTVTFDISGFFYLLVLSLYDGSKHGIDSIIYSFNGNALVRYQSVPTDGAVDGKYFEIDGERYLAIAQHYGGRTSLKYAVKSQVLKWKNGRFELVQSLPTKGAYSVEYFDINEDRFLAFANYYDTSHSTNSQVYKWISGQFELFQSIPSLAAISIKHIQIGNIHFLAIAHHLSGSTRNTDSKIYRWSGAQFEIFQSIPTFGAHDVDTFTLYQFTFILFANSYNEKTKSHNVNSMLYTWSGNAFEEFQSIATKRATDFEAFTACGKQYVAIAHNHGRSPSDVPSIIYEMTGAGLRSYQHIMIPNIIRWSAFTYANVTYLFAGPNESSKLSYVYKWVR